MQTCDVLIVGGGPAGSSCAWKLRRAGIDVVVLDKAEFPRHKVCGGWITPAVIDELDIEIADYQQHNLIQPITRFLTGMIGGREIETDYKRVVSYGIRRFEFDNYLLRRTGARMQLGEAFRSIRQENECWIVNDSIRARIVIGAGGNFCPVKRHFATENKASGGAIDGTNERDVSQSVEPVVVAQEVEFELSPSQREQCSVLANRPELFFCPDLHGYGWIFRKGDWLNIGLGRENEAHLTSHVASFVKSLQSAGKIPNDIPGPFRGHAYRLRKCLPHSSVPEGILLIGDAVGLAESQSGEGMRPAIESGLLAAASILETNGQNRDQLDVVFSEKMRRHFGDAPATDRLLTYVPAPVKQLAASWLMSTHWFSRRVLLDQWFLHSSLPALRV